MPERRQVLDRPAMRVFLLLLFLLLFSWPFLVETAAPPSTLFIYEFVCWLVLVFLICIAQESSLRRKRESEPERTGDDHV